MKSRLFGGIQALVLDVDGVLTDGGLYVGEEGTSRRFHAHDGMGLRRLQEAGVRVAWLTGHSDAGILRRARDLGIWPHVYEADDKGAMLARVAGRLGVPLSELAYLGDDLLDIPAMDLAGLPMAVAGSAPEVRAHARYVTRRGGGAGAVREVCERILASQARVMAVIPARYASTRFPGKPLVPIAGLPMVVRVARQVQQSAVDGVVVATDDDRIRSVCEAHGCAVVLTGSHHRTGTERMAEVATRKEGDVWVNVQGDEPLVPPSLIDAVVEALLEDGAADLSTARAPCRVEDQERPDVVKVVCDPRGRALYFSRSPIPFTRGVAPRFRHVGIYAFQRAALLRFAALPPSPLETMESLEQLRALEDGMLIRVVDTDHEAVGVDTPQDVERVERLLTRGAP